MSWMRKTTGLPLQWAAPALLGLALAAAPLPAAAEDEALARLAMSTASVLMMAEHEHEIEEALEEGDFEEALEEAHELVPWMKGTAWHHELAEPVAMSLTALETLIARIEAKDKAGAEAAFAEMAKHFNHLHHELMEIVGEGHGSGH